MKEKLFNILGIITQNQAKHEGFTHHGRYWIVPCYLNLNVEPIEVVEKHWIFIPITYLFAGIEWLYNQTLDDDFDDIGFTFIVKDKII